MGKWLANVAPILAGVVYIIAARTFPDWHVQDFAVGYLIFTSAVSAENGNLIRDRLGIRLDD